MPYMNEPLQPYVKFDGSIGAKPAEFDANGQLIPDPSWVQFIEKHKTGFNEDIVLDNLPMYLNLGDFKTTTSVIGFASAYIDRETKTVRLEIKLNKENSDLLTHLVEIADIKAIGFAGIMKKEQIVSND